jgi:putative ABC transport system permease protein
VTLDRAVHVLRQRWRSLARKGDVERQLADEIAYHLAEEADAHAARGLAPGAARQAAVAGFGGVERVKDACRDARGTVFLESVVKDLRFAVATLLRQPAYSVPALLALALGIGVTTAVFALVDGILLAGLPFPQADRLVSANATYPVGGVVAARRELRTMDVAAYADGQLFTLAGDGPAVRVTGARVSAELFSVLGASPALGRAFRAGEDAVGRDRVVILGHRLWVSRFAGDPRIVGRAIQVDGVAREVVGVMPAAFDLPSRRTQIWVPLGADARDTARYWAGDFMPLVGRLRPGVGRDAAQAELRRFQAGIGAQFPWTMPADWNRDLALQPLQDALVGPVRPRLVLLSIAVLFVLLIACANVANLSLSRAATREREMGIRTAIGGAPRRIARQLLTEHVLLSLAGAACGALLAMPLVAVLVRLLPDDTPRLAAVAVDARVLAFTIVVAVASGCAFGTAPVLHTLRLQLRAVLEAGGRSGGGAASGPVRKALAVAQIAAAALLVIAAGLLMRSLWTLSHADPGFRPEGLVTARLSADASRCGEPARCLAFYRDLEAGLQAIPGVGGVALANGLPLTGTVAKRSLVIDGFTVPAGESAPLFRLNVVTPGYPRLMGMPLVAGRGLRDADRAGAPVALVSAAAAARFWPARDPLGRHVRFVGESHSRTIVGVVGDVRAHDLTRDEPEWIDGTLYVPHGPAATLEDGALPAEMTAVLETRLPASAIESHLRRIAAERGGVVVDDVRPLTAIVAAASAAPASTATLLGATASMALALGSVGVYGVLSFLVSRRTRELGIRIALGAVPRDLCWVVLREGAVLSVAGLGLGVAGALVITRGLASELHGVSPSDPVTYLAVAAAMLVVTMAACLVPTARAMRVDPLTVLRDA